MLNDFYYGTIVQTNGYDEHKAIKTSVFYKVLESDENTSSYYYYDIETNKKYTASHLADGETGEYLDYNHGIIPVMKFLEYTDATENEIRNWTKCLHSYEKMVKLEKKVSSAKEKTSIYKNKVKKLGGIK